MTARNHQIVIAEDNPADVMMVRFALTKAVSSFNLKVIEDGGRMIAYVEALEQNIEPCPDLLLMDLNMPKAGGLEMMKRLRDGLLCASTPIIVLTSSSHPRDHQEALAMGAAHYFTKPDDFDAFLKIGDLIAEVLVANRSGG